MSFIDDDNMNFVERLLFVGFKRFIPEWEKKKGRYDGEFNTKNGWMGLTIYHPYERFELGDTVVELDLTRYGVKDIQINGGFVTEIPVNEKKITVIKGGKLIYENKFGVLPKF